MPTNKGTTNGLDSLNPKERQMAQSHQSSKLGTQEVQGKELATTLQSQESTETIKTPELESENHKIDKGLSKVEKLAQGWKEEKRTGIINGRETTITVLEKKLTPGAFVREYQDDGEIPKHLVGEQLFNKSAVNHLDVWNRLPSWGKMLTMIGETQEEKESSLKNNFQKDGKNMFPGCWDLNRKKFSGICEHVGFRLSGGYFVMLDGDTMGEYGYTPVVGLSLRFLKN